MSSNFSRAALLHAKDVDTNYWKTIKAENNGGLQVSTAAFNKSTDTTFFSESIAISGTFSTPWFDTEMWNEARLNLKSTLDSAPLGLKIEFSDDQITVKRTISLTNLSTSYWMMRQVPLSHLYVRITFVNDAVGVNQVDFDITFYSDRQLPYTTQSAPINIGTTTLAVRQVGDMKLDVSRSLDQSVDPKRIWGYAQNFNAGENRDMWNQPGLYTFLQAAEPLRVRAGGNVNDIVGGSGAWVVLVRGLDANWDEIEETINLAGAAASANTAQSFIRVNEFIVAAVGSYANFATNAGQIILEGSVTTTVLSTISAGFGSSLQGIISVPRGKTLYLKRLDLFSPNQKTFSGTTRIRVNADVVAPPFGAKQVFGALSDLQGQQNLSFNVQPPPSEKSDLWFNVTASTNNSNLSLYIQYQLVRNDSTISIS